jgi:hypothetical protein
MQVAESDTGQDYQSLAGRSHFRPWLGRIAEFTIREVDQLRNFSVR